MMAKKTAAFQVAHQANIERYSKILQTHLTAQERAFVERRLAEEYAALQTFNKNPANSEIPLSTDLRLDKISQYLSKTEVSILECVMQGDSNKAAAHKLQLTEAAVRIHIKSILRKIRALNQAHTAIGTTIQICFSNGPA